MQRYFRLLKRHGYYADMKFKIKRDTVLILSENPNPSADEPVYEILIGGRPESLSSVRRKQGSNEGSSSIMEFILDEEGFRGIWLAVIDGEINLGSEGNNQPFIQYQDSDPIPVKHLLVHGLVQINERMKFKEIPAGNFL